MTSNEIGTDIIFKKQLGLNLEIDQKYVGLKMKENNILSFNFRVPGALKDEVEAYFRRFKLGEPILVDIGGTGEMKWTSISCLPPYRKTSSMILLKRKNVKPAADAVSINQFFFFNYAVF